MFLWVLFMAVGLHNTLTACLSLGPSILSSIRAFLHQTVCPSINLFVRSSVHPYDHTFFRACIYIEEGRKYRYTDIYIYIYIYVRTPMFPPFHSSIRPSIIICNIECLETVGWSRYFYLFTDPKSHFCFQKSLMLDFIQSLVDVFHTLTYSFLLKVTSCFLSLYLIFLPSYA